MKLFNACVNVLGAILGALGIALAAFAFLTPAEAFDISVPLPRPSLPSFFGTPKFLDEPGRELSDEDLEAINAAEDDDRGKVAPLAEERANRKRRADRNFPPALDLSPQFAEDLPYSVALGIVVCESNFPLDEVGGLQAEITQLQKDLVGYLNIPTASEKIELCLFKDSQSYVNFIRKVFRGAPTDRPALYVKAKGPGVLMVKKDANMIVNIRHEMTHAYLNATLKRVPIWLDEGLAKYFETPPGERGFRNPYLKEVESSATGLFSSPPSLPRLERLVRVDQMRPREYRESWSWVHFMIHYSRDTHLILANYLRTLRPEEQEKISDSAYRSMQKSAPLKQALERYVPDYEKKYVEHFRNWDKRQAAYENARDSQRN